MTSLDISFLSNKDQFDDLLQEFITERSSLRTRRTRIAYRVCIRSFRRWWLGQGTPRLTQVTLLDWMVHGLQKAKVESIAPKLFALNRFLSFLKDKRLLVSNPMYELQQGYRLRGYRGILRELQRTGSVAAVISMADHPFSGPLGPSCLAYLEYLAALGKKCVNHRYRLVSFERFLRHHDVIAWPQVDRAFIEQWLCEYKSDSAYQQRCRLLVLADLFRFLVDRDEVAASPVPPPGAHRRSSLPPRIF